MKKVVNAFRIFEQDEAQVESKKSALKGYSSEIAIKRIEALMEIMPDRVRFGVPSDNKGHSLTYRDANGAIQKIMDIAHYYSGKGEDVKFFCWNISYSGSWDATKSLREKIDKAGGFGRETNMNLKKVFKYFSKNSEDVDNIRSISISIDTKSIRKAAAKNDNYPQPGGGNPQPSEGEEGPQPSDGASEE